LKQCKVEQTSFDHRPCLQHDTGRRVLAFDEQGDKEEEAHLEAVPSGANMGLTTTPPEGVPVPKRTLRGTLVGAEAFTSRSAAFALAFKSAFEAALPASQHKAFRADW